MHALDRLTNAIRRRIELWVPWYDPAEARVRKQETERVRQRSIAARVKVEKVVHAKYAGSDAATRARFR